MLTPSPHASSGERIWVVCPGGRDGRGGMGRHVRYFARTWADSGVGDAAHLPPLQIVDSYGHSKKTMPVCFLRAMLQLAAAAVTGRMALLHLHMAADGSVFRKLTMARLAQLARRPVIIHLHGSRFADYVRDLSPRRRTALAARLRAADAVLALGPFWRDLLVDDLGLSANRVHLVPNAVPGRSHCTRTATSNTPCRILFLGRLGERKGTVELIAALQQMTDTRNAWTATLAGDGEIERFRIAIDHAELAGRVNLTGWVEEAQAHALLDDADLLVLPSHNEGLPMAILEAMAAGLPVIATPVGAIPDAVSSGVNGHLVPVGDVDALAAAMRHLVEDEPLRRRMGLESLRVFNAQFSMDRFCGTVGALYADLIETASSSHGKRTLQRSPC